jgi:hypothetical protein
MSKEYVERRHGSFYLIESRVPLARIVQEFRRAPRKRFDRITQR